MLFRVTNKLRVFALCLSPCCFAGTLAFAQSISGVITEDFAEQSNVSGTLVVGARFGDAGQNVDLDSLRSFSPTNGKRRRACFMATTKDGLYHAEGVLDLPRRAGRYPISPRKDWRFSDKLSEYPVDFFAALMLMEDTCDGSGDALIVPTTFSEGGGDLTVYVNSRRALMLSAVLIVDDGRKIVGDCNTQRDERTTAFDTLCVFDLRRKPSSETMELVVTRTPRKGAALEEGFKIAYPQTLRQ